MKAWPDTNGSAIARYLRQLRLRSRVNQTYYHQALRSFQEVVVQRQSLSSQVNRVPLKPGSTSELSSGECQPCFTAPASLIASLASVTVARVTVSRKSSQPFIGDPGTRCRIGIKLLDIEAKQVVERRANEPRACC